MQAGVQHNSVLPLPRSRSRYNQKGFPSAGPTLILLKWYDVMWVSSVEEVSPLRYRETQMIDPEDLGGYDFHYPRVPRSRAIVACIALRLLVAEFAISIGRL